LVIDSIPQVVGMAYAIIATLVIVILLRKDRFSRRKGYIFLVVSTLFGFLVFAPMLPLQLQTILHGKCKANRGTFTSSDSGSCSVYSLSFRFRAKFLWSRMPHWYLAGTDLSSTVEEAEDLK